MNGVYLTKSKLIYDEMFGWNWLQGRAPEFSSYAFKYGKMHTDKTRQLCFVLLIKSVSFRPHFDFLLSPFLPPSLFIHSFLYIWYASVSFSFSHQILSISHSFFILFLYFVHFFRFIPLTIFILFLLLSWLLLLFLLFLLIRLYNVVYL